MRVAVLGAAGLMGAAILRDLAASREITDLTALDRCHGMTPEGLPVAAVDAEDRQGLALALNGSDLLVNAASYRVNVAAMDAALMGPCSYLDLGGLYHVTAQQLALDDAFAGAGQLAVLGCGAGPGKTNLMARWAGAAFSEIETIRCSSAGHDPVVPPPGTLALPYALETLLDELREQPMVLRDGVPVPLEPLTPGGKVSFPEPIGERSTLFTLHSEALTLGDSLQAPDVDFRLALTPRVEKALRAILDGGRVPPVVAPSDQTVSAQVVELTGTDLDGARRRTLATALTRPHDGTGGGVISTAAVAAAVARLLARGELADPSGFGPRTGVVPPEAVLDPHVLFPELEARGCSFTLTSEVLEP